MPFDWKDYLEIAHALRSQAGNGLPPEAALRSAVSRAYYAAFCHARNYAHERHGLPLRYTADDHGLVKRHFQTRRARTVADRLDALRQIRNKCDYENTVLQLESLLITALQDAQTVIAILK
jgi:hypothetical protein